MGLSKYPYPRLSKLAARSIERSNESSNTGRATLRHDLIPMEGWPRNRFALRTLVILRAAWGATELAMTLANPIP